MKWNEKNTITQMEKLLSNDEILIVSTDTVLGFLGCLTLESFNKINMIKQRVPDKNYLIVVKNYQKASVFIQEELISKRAQFLLQQCWPGPVTAVVKAKPLLANHIKSQDGTIAIRCPQHYGLQQLLEYFDGLYSTSANKSGRPIPHSLEELDKNILQYVACVVIDDKDLDNGLPSTIIDLSQEQENGTIKVIRDGAYQIKELERLYGSPFSC